jgi:pre-mRNA-splicing factor CWC22
MGLVKLNARLAEPSLQPFFSGIFPTDTMANMRFSINFFTSIGLGGITDRQRELYKQVCIVHTYACGAAGENRGQQIPSCCGACCGVLHTCLQSIPPLPPSAAAQMPRIMAERRAAEEAARAAAGGGGGSTSSSSSGSDSSSSDSSSSSSDSSSDSSSSSSSSDSDSSDSRDRRRRRGRR